MIPHAARIHSKLKTVWTYTQDGTFQKSEIVTFLTCQLGVTAKIAYSLLFLGSFMFPVFWPIWFFLPVASATMQFERCLDKIIYCAEKKMHLPTILLPSFKD